MLKNFSVSVEPYQYDYLMELVRAWRTQEYNYEIQESVKTIEDELDKIKKHFTNQ